MMVQGDTVPPQLEFVVDQDSHQEMEPGEGIGHRVGWAISRKL